MNLNEMNEIEQIDYVKKYYKNIGDIYNPSEIVQIEAVKSDIDAIKYIKNPTELVQLYLVNRDFWSIKYIIGILGKNPSKQVQKNP